MDRIQSAHALLSKYIKLYTDKYKTKPVLNRYKEKYAMLDVMDSVGYERAIEILEYYFSLNRLSHPLSFFLYNFERMDEVMVEIEKNNIRRNKIMQETAERVKQWEEANEFGSPIN